ncbi:DUF6611 family protein [Marisediminicola sp. LYQ134]|uniref:DUF6611 family protein n=1 Tax=unclassified Marisediminicola TaxID=2618316 RepID=UPI0039830B89
MTLSVAMVRHWPRWALDGRHRWGYSRLRSRRYGAQSLAVHVYQPGEPRVLRRCAHLSRMWTPISAVGTLTTAPTVAVVAEISMLSASAGPLALLILAGTSLNRISAPVRARLITVSARRAAAQGDVAADAEFHAVHDILDALRDAERQLDAGAITGAEFDETWAGVAARIPR